MISANPVVESRSLVIFPTSCLDTDNVIIKFLSNGGCFVDLTRLSQVSHAANTALSEIRFMTFFAEREPLFSLTANGANFCLKGSWKYTCFVIQRREETCPSYTVEIGGEKVGYFYIDEPQPIEELASLEEEASHSSEEFSFEEL